MVFMFILSDLGDYYYDIGNLSEAVKFYTLARDQSSNHRQLCDINLSTASGMILNS